jgi:hypothetical protein
MPERHEIAIAGAGKRHVGILLQEANDLSWYHASQAMKSIPRGSSGVGAMAHGCWLAKAAPGRYMSCSASESSAHRSQVFSRIYRERRVPGGASATCRGRVNAVRSFTEKNDDT